jgi:flavin reductase (DIM6/NTAB) family NADH-FMN oxidoreductase RutF
MTEQKNSFVEISPYTISENVFKLIDKDWFLLTAGNPDHYNCMTASWGSLGILWNRPVAICFVRPVRYTFNFMDSSQYFSLCFFNKEYWKILNYCGSKSGKNVDKISSTGLVTKTLDEKYIYYEQAKLVLLCQKIYFQDIDPEHFLIPEIEKLYPDKDYHRMFIGNIVKCLIK